MTFTGVTNAAVRLTRKYAIKSDFMLPGGENVMVMV